jgi:hypothetical protein
LANAVGLQSVVTQNSVDLGRTGLDVRHEGMEVSHASVKASHTVAARPIAGKEQAVATKATP